MIVLATVLAVAVPLPRPDPRKTSWPTVQEVEASLSAKPGQPFAKLLPTKNGLFRVYYLGTTVHGGGRYAVEVGLEKWTTPPRK